MKISSSRREFLIGGSAAAMSLAVPALAQEDFPRGPVRLIIPLTAGGAADASGRALAVELEKIWGKPVVVENRPGGLFQIAMQALMSAPADGQTLLHLHNSLASVQATQKLYDMEKQLAAVSLNMETPMVMLVNGKSPYRSVGDIVAYAKANPGKLTYSTLGPGSVEHLKTEQFGMLAGFKATNVPYKAGPDMLKGLLSGEVDLTLTAGIFGKMYSPSGQARTLAVMSNRRWDDLPDVPTIREAGFDVPPLAFWGGFAVRHDTPPALIARLHRDIAAASAQPSVAERLAKAGMKPVVSKSPDEFQRFIASEVRWMSDLAKSLDLKMS